MSDEQWEVLGRESALQHPYVTVEMERVRLPNGRVIPDWPIVSTKDYINVLVLNEDGQAMIIEGYKHAVGHSSWQVVGGYLEEGEDPLTAAQRELMEETGYQSDHWHHLGSFIVDVNRYVGTGHFYLARRARQVAEANHDDLEQFSIHWVSADELVKALQSGRVSGISYALNIALGLLAIQSID